MGRPRAAVAGRARTARGPSHPDRVAAGTRSGRARLGGQRRSRAGLGSGRIATGVARSDSRDAALTPASRPVLADRWGFGRGLGRSVGPEPSRSLRAPRRPVAPRGRGAGAGRSRHGRAVVCGSLRGDLPCRLVGRDHRRRPHLRAAVRRRASARRTPAGSSIAPPRVDGPAACGPTQRRGSGGADRRMRLPDALPRRPRARAPLRPAHHGGSVRSVSRSGVGLTSLRRSRRSGRAR